MKTATVRDFKIRATQYLASEEEVVVTRRGKPVAVVTPVREGTPAALLVGLRRILRESGVTKSEALQTLSRVRKEVYG